jgi:cob(I)alamin adenosyltransferase
MNPRPRILLLTGDGKGKTTAALGMALRASGHGMKVCVVQFIKADPTVGEVIALGHMANVEIFQTGLGFVPASDDPRIVDHRAAAERGLRLAADVIARSDCFLVVLDEICLAVTLGLLAESQVIELLRQARPESCLVLTGRGASQGLIDLADTVTEMRSVKHAMHAGVPAQKGVER